MCLGICQHYHDPYINIPLPCHCTFGRACLMLPYLVQWKTSRWEKWLLDLLHKILEERELVISAPPICLWRHLWVYVMVSNLTVTHIKPRIMICLTHLTSLAAIVETQSIVAQLGFDAVSSPPFWRNFQCTFWTVLAILGFQIFALFPRNFYNRHRRAMDFCCFI